MLISVFQASKIQQSNNDADEPEVTLWSEDDDVIHLDADEIEMTEFTGNWRQVMPLWVVCFSSIDDAVE